MSKPMAMFVRAWFVLGMLWGSEAAQIMLPSLAAASEIRLRAAQLQQILDADSTDLAQQTTPPSESEIKAVQLRLSQLRAIDADTDKGQDQLMKVIEDLDTLAYIRNAAFTFMAEAEMRQLKQLNGNTADGQAELLQVLKNPDTPSSVRQGVLEHLAKTRVRTAAVQQAALQLIRKDIDKHLCRCAIYVLQNLGVPAEGAVPVLILMLDDHRNCSARGCSSGEISSAATDALGGYGAAAAGAIPWLAWEIDPANRRSINSADAQRALGRIAPNQFPFFIEGRAAIKPLLVQLSSDIQGRRLRAAERLLELHEYAGSATAALETALHDDDVEVRATAAAAILATKPHQGASGVLMQLAHSENSDDRARLIQRLSDYKLNFDDGKVLRGFLSDLDPNIRSAAASRLAKTDRYVSEAFEAMVALYNLGGKDNQYAALKAFGSFRPELLRSEKALIAKAAMEEGGVGYLAKGLQRTKFSGGTDDGPAK